MPGADAKIALMSLLGNFSFDRLLPCPSSLQWTDFSVLKTLSVSPASRLLSGVVALDAETPSAPLPFADAEERSLGMWGGRRDDDNGGGVA